MAEALWLHWYVLQTVGLHVAVFFVDATTNEDLIDTFWKTDLLLYSIKV